MSVQPSAPQHHQTRAQRYGIEHYPKLVRDMLLFFIGLREDGITATFRSARTIILLRAHMKLFDLPFMGKMQQPLYGERALQGMTLTAIHAEEATGGTHCSPMPSKVLEWAVAALPINPDAFHFVDVGSGWGYNMLRAAKHDFISVSGVEYAQELHNAAVVNVTHALETGLVPHKPITARHESALEMAFPEGGLVLCLFHPFDAVVMAQFMQHLKNHAAAGQHTIFIIYVNTVEHKALEQGGFVERLSLPAQTRIRNALFNPFSVRLYRVKN